MSLISAAEMAAIQMVAESGMQTAVYIQRRVTNRSDEDGWSETWVEDGSPVIGWLYEFTPGSAVIGVISGEMGLAEAIWLRVPIGTNIESGDRARFGTTVMTVEHTNADSTYRPWISCAMRALA